MKKSTLARRISGKQTGHFESPEWEARKVQIKLRVIQGEEVAMQRAIQRKLKEAVELK